MPTFCLVSSLLLLVVFTGTLEAYCVRKEQHKPEDKPLYTGEFGKEKRYNVPEGVETLQRGFKNLYK